MNEKKMQQWEKWHNRGYGKFMMINMAGVCAFYAFSGTIAIVQLSMNRPKGTSLLTIILPGIVLIAILIPAAFLFMHVTWKMKEKQYAEYLLVKQAGDPTQVTEATAEQTEEE